MSNLNYSGFLSNLINTSYGSGSFTDILSTVSPQITLTTSLVDVNYNSIAAYGRYFCLGDLLIQFSDNSGNTSPTQAVQSTFTTYYPYPYESNPYVVLVSSFNSGNTWPSSASLTTYTNSSFNFHISSNNGNISFLVIGPRPSSL
jgi:hypothetical protein